MDTRLAGHIDRCIFSFVEMYKKHGIFIQTCGPEENYAGYGIETSGCVTLDMLGRANSIQFRNLKHKGFREGCQCMESRDIGALNSCPNGCKYCYANKNSYLPQENYIMHDPESSLLIGHLKPTDNLQPGWQKTLLKQEK